MAIYADRVQETTTTTGTGTVDLGGAKLGFQTFVAGVGGTTVVDYTITDGTDWEVGEGTVTDAGTDTLSRTTVYSSSNAGALVSFAAGSKDVFLTASADALGGIGAGGITWVTKTANYTATVGEGVLADTSAAAFTLTLPSAPSDLDTVHFMDSTSSWVSGGTKNLTVARNGKTIMGLAEDLECNMEHFAGGLIYLSATTDWRIL